MKKKQILVLEALELRQMMAIDLTTDAAELPRSCFALEFVSQAAEQPLAARLMAEAEAGRYASESSSVQIVLVNGHGNEVEEVVSGREYWMEIRTKDIREVPAGVFAAYVDIAFPSRSLEIIGSPIGIGSYKNGRNGVPLGADRLKTFGGFANSIEPTGPTATIAAVRVKAGEPGALTLDVALSQEQGTEFLLYGVNEEVDPAKVTISIPQYSIISERESTTPDIPLADQPPAPTTAPETVENLLKFQLSFIDSSGQTVTVLKPNQEYTLQLKATDLRTSPIGVFSGFVDISFEPGAIEVIGSPTGTDSFLVPKNYIKVSEGKIQNFGALSQTVFYPYTSESVIAALRVRAGSSGDANLRVVLTEGGIGTSIYGYGELEASQVEFVIPNVSIAQSYDANGDGVVSPLDALLLIDYLVHRFDTANAESKRTPSTISFDMSNDGVVSAVDVLLIIDYLQLRAGSARSSLSAGEGESVFIHSSSEEDNLIESLASDQVDRELTSRRARRG